MSKRKKNTVPAESKKDNAVIQGRNFKTLWQSFFVILILGVTVICFLPATSGEKEFTNWDDPGYVINQTLIKSLSKENLEDIFTPSTQVMLNYHPLTMLSLAFNYHYSKLDPGPYVLTNIFFHLLDTFLVFVFFFSISSHKFWVGLLCALWFGIHPMHVESVAWVSERKDVIYCFFFLLSCISYLHYVKSSNYLSLIACFLFFVFSCLGKAMAVPLPIVLLLIDFFRGRRINFKAIAEKIPFLLVALWVGYNAVKIQSAGAIADYSVFSTFQRIAFASYGFMMYWVKFFVPLNLSAVYPYPSTDANGNIPFIYSISPLIVLLMFAVPLFYLIRKRKWEGMNVFIFGTVFFSLMIALVLQFVSVGIAIMADRYSYVSYLGIFFIAATYVNEGLERPGKKMMYAAVTIAFSGWLAFLCHQRVKVWTNSETLWTDVINQYPYVTSQSGSILKVEKPGVETAYKNRGNYYREHDRMDKAFEDYNVLVTVHAQDAGAYSNMGNMYAIRGDFPRSLEMYSEAVKRDSLNYETYFNRGTTFSKMNRHEEAENDFEKAIKINPSKPEAFSMLAFEHLRLNHYDTCISLCTSLISKDGTNPLVFFYRAVALANSGKADVAIADLRQAVTLNPSYPEAWFNLAVLYSQSGRNKEAFEAVQKAKLSGYNVDPAFMQKLTAAAK